MTGLATDSRAQSGARVVVAGVGAVTAQGPTAAALWEGIMQARVVIGPVGGLRLTGHTVTIGAQVPDAAVDPRRWGRAPTGDRLVDMAVQAGAEALAEAGPGAAEIAPSRWAVVMASCRPGVHPDWVPGDVDSVRLSLALMPQGIVERVSAAFGAQGPVLAIDTACAGGANAVGYAADLIRLGHADAALAGGAELLSDLTFAGFGSVQALSCRAATPYSRHRSGLSLGEGSAMLVLVRAELCDRLGVRPVVEVLGYGLSADGYHPTAPHPQGDGAARAINAALEASGVDPRAVAYVNGHGTGTEKNDVAETKAIRRALGPAADRVAVSSTKSMIGHLLGAAGATEVVVTAMAVRDQAAPPTAGLLEADPECDLDYVPLRARPLAIDVAISNSFGFGGANACVVVGRPGSGVPRSPRQPDPVVITGIAAETSEPGAGGNLAPDWSAFLTPKQCRRLDRLSIFAVVGAGRALSDAGLVIDEQNGKRVGIMFASALGPHESQCLMQRSVVDGGPAAANPAEFPNIVRSAAPGCVATHLGTRGPLSAVVAGHAAGGFAIGYAADIVRQGDADAMVVTAADSLSPTALRAYREIGLVAGIDGDLVLAEALAGLVLEPLSRARVRGAEPYGEVLGYGMAADARPDGGIDPAGRGIERAMSAALSQARLEPHHVTAVWSAAAGHRLADAAEASAIDRLFDGVPVCSPKLAIGEVLGAGALVLCADALAHLGSTPAGGGSSPARPIALVNSSSVGGSHVSIALAGPSDPRTDRVR